jgi:hypothetical protein
MIGEKWSNNPFYENIFARRMMEWIKDGSIIKVLISNI